MRVLLSTYGSRGDVEPLVALAVRLRELDAEVLVGAPPDDDFVQRLADVGVTMIPVGRSARALTKAAPAPSSLPERAAELVESQFETLLPAAAGCDLVVATGVLPAAAGALSIAEKLSVRSVSVTFQQLTLPSPHHRPLAYAGRPFPPDVTDNATLWELDAQSIDTLFSAAVNRSRATVGLPPVPHIRDYVIGDNPLLATDPVLDPWRPAPLEVVQTGAWLLPDDRPLPADLEEFLAAGTPPVYVGFGSMPMHQAADVARVAIDAVRAQGHRAIVKSGWADLALADDGTDWLVVDEVNHQALFPRTAAIVHHGGAGTTTTASMSGVPQVVVPQATDQPYWAGRVADLGIGVAHEGAVPTTGSLSAALANALTPEIRTRAAEVGPTIRTDGAAVAAKLLAG